MPQAVGHALKAVELLMASDDNTAYELAYELESMNKPGET